MNYNGKVESISRRYNSLKNFIGDNTIYKAGEILCVSTKDNGYYDVTLEADGELPFRALYKNWQENPFTPEDMRAFLAGFSGKRKLVEILRNMIRIIEEGESVRIKIDDLENV